MRTLIYTIFFSWTIYVCTAQSPTHDLILSKGKYTLEEVMDRAESHWAISFAYSANQVPLDSVKLIRGGKYSLEDIGKLFLYSWEIESQRTAPGKIVLTPVLRFTLSGIVRQAGSKETIVGAAVFNSQKTEGVYTNEDGFFTLTVPATDSHIYASYLGFATKIISFRPFKPFYIIELSTDNLIPEVIIKSQQNDILQEQFGRISLSDIDEGSGLTGKSDLFYGLRQNPGVHSGYEAQNGLLVRGGGADQNLILLDGLALYEASHLGGINSIFITDAIKDVKFFKTGFPARYGGRLSSVVNVRLKEGDREKISKKLGIGIEGVDLQMEGPVIEDRATFNLAARTSWFSYLASPLLKRQLDFTDTALNYSDLYGKFTYWFTPSSRISFSGYTGNDLVRFKRELDLNGMNDQVNDINRIEWGNDLLAMSWHQSIGRSFFFNLRLGVTQYNYSSKGSYQYLFEVAESLSSNSYGIEALSNINDWSIGVDLDHYSPGGGVFKFGCGIIDHNNNPSLLESEDFLGEDPAGGVVRDSAYKSLEYFGFVEHQTDIFDRLNILSGLRLNGFSFGESNYLVLQPRLVLRYSQGRVSATASASRMHQFMHLLTNPGPGLPSDLWVPSTEKIRPQSADEVSLEVAYKWNSLNLTFAGFSKKMNNLIEYINDYDLFYSFVIDDDLFRVQATDTEWQDRVTTGAGKASGIEFGLQYVQEKISVDFFYTLSRSVRNFQLIDDNASFPFKFDRTHDIHASFRYRMNKRHAFLLKWVYGTGHAYTLATVEILGPEGDPLLIPTSRNNARTPGYHHLDIAYSYTRDLGDESSIRVDLGLYNVYNRKNPYYVYLLQEPSSNAFSLRKVSLFPILPQLNFQYKW